jgi:hypothetical protein
MKKNIGKTDGIVRLIFVALLVFFYFILNLEGTIGLIVLGIAFLLCLTVFTGICPLYYPFGISTRKKEK